MAITRKIPIFRLEQAVSSAWVWAVMLLSLIATIAGWIFVHDHYVKHGQSEFDIEAAKFVSGLNQSLTAYEEVMRSGAALVTAKPDLSNDDWRSFVQATGLAKRCPGFPGVAFIARAAPASGAPASGPSAGRADQGDLTAPNWTVVLSEPSNWLSLQGLLASHNDPNSSRSAALARARDTGEVAKSGRVNFGLSGESRPGFIIYLSAYAKSAPLDSVAERRQALIGYIVMPFRMAGFVTGVMQRYYDDVHSRLRVEVFDGLTTASESELFDSVAADKISAPEDARFITNVKVNQFGRDWTLRFSSLPAFEHDRHPFLPWMVLVCGLTLSLLLCAALESSRRRSNATRRNTAALNIELVHRVKNTLAVVQSIANRTLSDDRSMHEGRELFANRLEALARTHSLIMDSASVGAAMGELVRGELAPLAHRASAHGPDISLSPQVAQSLALVLHDLAVDSVKRGADAIDVGWTVENGDAGGSERYAIINWTERGSEQMPSLPTLAQQIMTHGFANDAVEIAMGSYRSTFRVPLDTLA